ncbi:hypothetical protein ACIPW5_32395 [Streptomyces sp. NPDC090077]|uniref:hypothetical protein n=1 Tax=Streptomyces sp. NPDC090077 TaxID=3365938 RepID=UPI0038031E1B
MSATWIPPEEYAIREYREETGIVFDGERKSTTGRGGFPPKTREARSDLLRLTASPTALINLWCRYQPQAVAGRREMRSA